jgi:hypothetical protein
MNYTKAELVPLLRPIVVQRTGKTLAEANAMLQALDVEELGKILRTVVEKDPAVQESQKQLRQTQAERQQESAFFYIFRNAVNIGGVDQVPVDNSANRQIILSWVNEHQGEQISPEWFSLVLREQPRLARQLTWQSADVLNPVKQRQAAAAQSEDDRALFLQMARQNNVADTEANFLLVRSLIGSGFDRSRLAHALTMRGLSAATAEDQQQWKEERIEQENARLASDEASPREKRQIAYQRTVDEHRTAVHTQIEFELVTGFERDVVYGGKASPLPQEWGGQPLTSEFIRKCDKNILKTMIHRYGSSQVTARLRGIKKATAVIDRGNGKGPVEVSYEFA